MQPCQDSEENISGRKKGKCKGSKAVIYMRLFLIMRLGPGERESGTVDQK